MATLVVLLLASPVLATVSIIVDNDAGKAAIKYSTTGEKVRAFALDITVDKGTITAISDYIKGESNATQKGYGIFPANFGRYITVDADSGEVTNWNVAEYTPVAASTDVGALGGLGTGGITIEMGALYYPTNDSSPNAPPNSGTLCKLTLSECAKVSVVLNAARGGVVLTDPAVAATVSLTQATGKDICAAQEVVPSTAPYYAEWVKVGKPICWGYPRQCRGDADGKSQGAAKTGIYYVGTNDLNVLIASWLVKEPPTGPGIASIQNGICADFAHNQQGSTKTGFYRVGTDDLNILIASWLVKEPALGPGIPADCGGTAVPQ
jgi:hypothetical protein